MVFDANEAAVLAEVADQLVRLITDSPDDPAASVLFPIGYADPAAQAEFSRFTRSDLSERKVAAATGVRDAMRAPASADGVVVELEPSDAWGWLTFFTDLRLVLAERIRQSAGSEEHEIQQGLSDWAAYLQGAMVDELSVNAFQSPTDSSS